MSRSACNNLKEHIMKLYHSTSSPNSRRVRMFIAEKGISIPFHPVNLGEKEQFSDWFTAINPRQQVPVLMLDDDTTIAEVPAIRRYLEETHPERPLLGSDARGKALVTMWERRVELDGFAPTMEGVRNAVAEALSEQRQIVCEWPGCPRPKATRPRERATRPTPRSVFVCKLRGRPDEVPD
jgi:glutathione S-transferase